MRTHLCLSVLAAVLLSGCGAEESSSSRFTPVTDVQGLMVNVVEPAAETYWDAAGWIMDIEEGTTVIRPESEEEWMSVRSAAYTLAESGNLLMMESRAVDDEAWMGMSRSMIEVARRAIEAAEARNVQAVFDMGGEVYQTCLNCHAQYARRTLRPNVRTEN